MNKPKKSKKKQKTKSKNKDKYEKPKRRKKKKKQKNKDPNRLRDIQIPVELQLPQCQVCEEKKADFYCKECKVHCCKNCESQVHTPYLRELHYESTFKEPYIQEINPNLCIKHKKELCFYCKDENELICNKCHRNCSKNKHSTLSLHDYSNEISRKIKIMLNKIQKEEIQKNETIKRTRVNQNKLKQEIKDLSNFIENESEEKKKKLNKNKNKIKKIEKLEKDEKTIKIIRKSKEILSKEEERKKKKKNTKKKKKLNIRRGRGKKIIKEREEFDPKMNCENIIKLKNENKTAWNPSSVLYYDDGIICGKKIYSSGKHQIKIKIDQFPNPKNKDNQICLGVVKTENRQNFIKKWYWEKTYFFKTWRDIQRKKNQSLKIKIENRKIDEKNYPENIYLKKNDIFEISLDMDIRKFFFKINEKNLGGWENLPEKVNFFASLMGQMGEEKNQITII
ncbi:tripartite motif-containing 33-like [Anaeramoeba flamelloides]|uniref:Tripartite motif-containing 33-like n=1 Tax=Anaeramoeba flamelloides TaxID=1746091 RepID=A0AAV7Z7H0_9EUKA|nr:tripartite motif-containing 33-like [Anaeramoeba flamelloides]